MVFLFSIYRFFCSLRLAVLTLSALILLFAIGTFYESAQGREVAKEIIYDSVYMNVLLSLLALNIMAVMLDRLPWKKKHIPFLLAHFGILFVIAGAFITRFYGVDGYIRLSQGEQSQYITGGNVFLNVYASFDGANLNQLYRDKTFFFRHPPTPKKPYTISLGSSALKVKDFYPSAMVRESYKPAKRGGTALRFLMEGSQAKEVRWLFRPPYQEKANLSLGPVQILLLKSFPQVADRTHLEGKTGPVGDGVYPTFNSDHKSIPNHTQKTKVSQKTSLSETNSSLTSSALWLVPGTKGLKYQLIQSGKINQQGFLKKGSVLKTGWMDFQFQLLEYWPKALPHRVFTPLEKVNDQSVSAIQVDFEGETKWMGLNSQLFFFDEDKVYIVAYGQEQKKVDFSLKLKKFKVQHYPFSRKARSYESEVQISVLPDKEGKKALISMNQPLKWGAYTIYQSGFEESERGEPIASVFSVNKDPGRLIKYFGSLLVVLGICMLFLKRNRRQKIN